VISSSSTPGGALGHLNGLCETIEDLVGKELRFRHFSLPRTRGHRNPRAAKISASAFRLKLKNSKTPGDEHCLDRQALNCWLGSEINQANVPS
jgi:hypothetical protein